MAVWTTGQTGTHGLIPWRKTTFVVAVPMILNIENTVKQREAQVRLRKVLCGLSMCCLQPLYLCIIVLHLMHLYLMSDFGSNIYIYIYEETLPYQILPNQSPGGPNYTIPNPFWPIKYNKPNPTTTRLTGLDLYE